jgi:hypothetical protein
MSEDIMTALGQRFDRLEQLTLIKSELEDWLLERRVPTQAEVEAQAITRNSITRIRRKTL